MAERDADDYGLYTDALREPLTLKDVVRKELRDRLEDYAASFPRVELDRNDRRAIAEHLAPLVCELIDHALQMDRVERGLLPYDEE